MAANDEQLLRDEREFARIDVDLRALVMPLEEARVAALSEEILARASVWAPLNEAALRNLASSGSASNESMLAQAVLELTTQVVSLRAKLGETPGLFRPARLVQLSGGGGRISSDVRFDLGDWLELRFDDDALPPIRALCQIVHSPAGDPGCGFRLGAIHPHDQDLLVRVIYQLQRAALRSDRED